jgi:hypothetical protein
MRVSRAFASLVGLTQSVTRQREAPVMGPKGLKAVRLGPEAPQARVHECPLPQMDFWIVRSVSLAREQVVLDGSDHGKSRPLEPEHQAAGAGDHAKERPAALLRPTPLGDARPQTAAPLPIAHPVIRSRLADISLTHPPTPAGPPRPRTKARQRGPF